MLKNCLCLIKANALTYVSYKCGLTQLYYVIIKSSYFFSNKLSIKKEFAKKNRNYSFILIYKLALPL